MLPQISQELTKTQIKIIADNTVNDILENGNVIDVADTIAKMQLMINEIKKNPKFIDYLRDEISKYGKSHTTSSGTKLELCESGTVFNYSQTGDLKYFELLEKQEKLKKEIDERENFLKAISISGLDIVTEDGEAIKIYPPSKSSTSSYKTTIQK